MKYRAVCIKNFKNHLTKNIVYEIVHKEDVIDIFANSGVYLRLTKPTFIEHMKELEKNEILLCRY